ncbi:hypothetical protein L5515_001001 [Caenorhabditis briggsae]|uniref:Saposin B-type domain-containing protein n=1 Tax=Caenorhabditis briggsae TaxID=6238 RepID=A0AAE9IZ16_CAEBR|nr:hypothetical protein L3Y34_014922 [Caenorhabditis briggsae]UMM12000.1 hypothetical protein L5515_001001 [Caenorhabditis briggsae]
MKLFRVAIFFLTICFLKTTYSLDPCVLCSSFLAVPKTWDNAAEILNVVCTKLGCNECGELLKSTDLTTSYANMYPHIVDCRTNLCRNYCKKMLN